MKLGKYISKTTGKEVNAKKEEGDNVIFRFVPEGIVNGNDIVHEREAFLEHYAPAK